MANIYHDYKLKSNWLYTDLEEDVNHSQPTSPRGSSFAN